MYEHNALGYWSGLALCLTKVRSSRARCPATALMVKCHFSKTSGEPSLAQWSSGFIILYYSDHFSSPEPKAHKVS